MFRHLLVTICDHRSWHSETELVDGVLAYYGRDLTFSVPILMMCALAGIVTDWRRIPPFPFELATVIRANATTERHPFTGAPAGGWGWTNLSGGVDFLWHHYEAGTLYRREPIGLYFSRLWYSEDLYSLTYLVTALRRISNYDF